MPAVGWFAATFQAPGIWCDLYVDIATPGEWDGTVLRAVDLDLDVIRLPEQLPPAETLPWETAPAGPGEVFVDDEDEFAEHQVAYGYPAEVIAAAQASCDQVLAAVRAGTGAVRRHAPALARGAQSPFSFLSARRSARDRAR